MGDISPFISISPLNRGRFDVKMDPKKKQHFPDVLLAYIKHKHSHIQWGQT